MYCCLVTNLCIFSIATKIFDKKKSFYPIIMVIAIIFSHIYIIAPEWTFAKSVMWVEECVIWIMAFAHRMFTFAAVGASPTPIL